MILILKKKIAEKSFMSIFGHTKQIFNIKLRNLILSFYYVFFQFSESTEN